MEREKCGCNVPLAKQIYSNFTNLIEIAMQGGMNWNGIEAIEIELNQLTFCHRRKM